MVFNKESDFEEALYPRKGGEKKYCHYGHSTLGICSSDSFKRNQWWKIERRTEMKIILIYDLRNKAEVALLMKRLDDDTVDSIDGLPNSMILLVPEKLVRLWLRKT